MATALGLHIGTRIRQAREEAGFSTQQALADALPSPINNQYVSKWEKGVKPKDETLALIGKVVGREVGWFYEDFQKTGPTPDPFPPADDLKAQIEAQSKAIESRLAALDEQMTKASRQLDDLLTAIGLNAERGATLEDLMLRALEKAMSERAEKIARRRPKRAPGPPGKAPPRAA